MAKNETRKPKSTALESAPAPISSEAAEPEVIDSASEALRPFLRDARQAPQVALQVVSAIQMHVGPLPPPETLNGYDLVLPGAAREIMDMALREQAHRHTMEKSANIYPFIGLVFGLIAFLCCIAGAVFLALNNQVIVAGLLVGAPLIGAVGWFVNSRLQIRQTAALAIQSTRRTRRRT
ncbi:MAG: DUF2335 domain-containing protein [Janthinobacterium lividum]